MRCFTLPQIVQSRDEKLSGGRRFVRGCTGLFQARVEGRNGLDDHIRNVAEEARIDPVGRIGGLMVIGVVFYAEVDKRHARVMEQAVIG